MAATDATSRRWDGLLRQALALLAGGVILLGTLAFVVFGATDERQTTAATTPPTALASPTAAPIVRELLAAGLPPAAPGQRLDLVRYTIAPGATLPVHVHPGMQAAWIESGELTYHVLKDEVPISRQVGQPTAASSEVVAAGRTVVLGPNDALLEAPGVVHYGENLGTAPVVIWAATLFADGQPSAIPVNSEGTPGA